MLNLNTEFELQLHNRFASLQDLGSENLELEQNTIDTQPSLVTHSTLSSIVGAPPDNLYKQNDSIKISHEGDTIHEFPYQQSHCDQIIPLESNQTKIPAEILMNKTNCADYVNCSKQNGTQFGFIPLTPLKVYTGAQTFDTVLHDLVHLHKTVKASNLPNFMACRIPLKSQLNITNWKKYLVNYWDQQLLDLLAFGFP